MTAQDVLRELRRVRYSPRKKRYLGITRIASQAGYGRTALYNAIVTGYVTKRMADHVGTVFQNVQIARDEVPRSPLGEYDGGVDARGGPRPARRPDDGRLRAARLLRGNASSGPYGGGDDHAGADDHAGGSDSRGGPCPARRPDDRRLRSAQASGDTSGANAYLGPLGGKTENALSRGPYGGGTAKIRAPGTDRPSAQTPAVIDKLNAMKQAPTQVPTSPATIRIDVGRLLAKKFR
jgi:hypothetical protein